MKGGKLFSEAEEDLMSEQKPGCVCCGAADAGGYEIEELDGSFCCDCWIALAGFFTKYGADILREHSATPAPAPTRETLAVWQPIETAPKDRWVWMYSRRSRSQTVSAFRWDGQNGWFAGTGWWPSVNAYFSHWAEMTSQPPFTAALRAPSAGEGQR